MNKFAQFAWIIVIAILFCGSDMFIFIGIGLAIGIIGALIGPEKIEDFWKKIKP